MQTFYRQQQWQSLIGSLVVATLVMACEEDSGLKAKRNCTTASACAQAVKVSDAEVEKILATEYQPVLSAETGEVTALPGLAFDKSVAASNDITTTAIVAQQNTSLFSFTPPPGTEVRYSNLQKASSAPTVPNTASTTGKALTTNGDDCELLSYSATVPKFRDVPLEAGQYFACIQVINPTTQTSFYLKSPNLHVGRKEVASPVANIAVDQEQNASNPFIVINNGSSHTAMAQVLVSISATNAAEFYMTNDASCKTGGVWQPLVKEKIWALGQSNDLATVYVKFRSVPEKESACVADTIIHDNRPPSSASININGASTSTSSAQVTLTMASPTATEMYTSSAMGCASGGVWEPFAASRGWTLTETGIASVYAKFRDEAGNETACVLDTILYSQQVADTSRLLINSGATYSNNAQVSLSLSSVYASQVYITNTAGCATGGQWQAYTTSQSWTLPAADGTTLVYAKFRGSDGAESSCVSDSIILDQTAPTGVSLALASGGTSTKGLTPSLQLTPNDASEVYLTNTAACASGGSWQAVTSPRYWTLSTANAVNTIYAKYRDAALNESACVSLNVTHDDTPPTGISLLINSGASQGASPSVSLTLGASDAQDMLVTNTAGCTGTWEAYTSSKPWTLPQSSGLNTLYAKFRDAAGNESACLAQSIVIDPALTSNASFAIAGGAAYATNANVTLNLSASGAQQVYITNTAGCASGGAWQSNASTKTWLLGQTNGVATVYVKFRDGIESSCLSDTIIHDDTPPSSGSIVINSNDTYTQSSIVSLALSASGAHEMYVTNTAGCASGGSWQAYATALSWTLGQSNAATAVYVKFRDEPGNETACLSDAITHDDQAPSATTVAINSGVAATNDTAVSLSLGATGASSMYISNTAGCSSGGSWESFTTSKSWTLAQTNGIALVYAKFLDAAGNESACQAASITHDNVAPASASISINSGAALTNASAVNLSLLATSAASMYITNTASCSAGGTWEAYAATKAWTLGASDAAVAVYVKFKDEAGNESSCVSDAITHDGQAPTSPSLSIAGGASSTASSTVALTLSATAADQMYITNTAACASGGTWESYATTRNWTLGQSNATATVYVKYRDSATNETSCVSANIVHDNTPPANPSLSIAGGAVGINTTSVTLTLAATSATEMYITNTSDCSGGGTWEAYATSKSWTLGQTAGIATVYAQYRDATLNTTGCVSDTILHDAVAPTAPTNFNDGKTLHSSLALSWAAGNDALSGIAAYDVAVGTTIGGTNILDWTSVGNGTSANLSSITGLTLGTTYYASIRSRDNAGNLSAVVNGDGFLHGFQQSAYVKLPQTTEYDYLNGVAISGDTIVVGAGGEDSNITTVTNGSTYSMNELSSDAGAAFVLRKKDGIWAYEAMLKAPVADSYDRFGGTVGLSGNTAVVAAYGDSSNQTTITNGTGASTDNSAAYAGAAYVFQRTGSTWAQQAYLKAPNAEGSDFFGYTLDISGDTIAVASAYEASVETTITNGTGASAVNGLGNAGAVYMFRRTGTSWASEAYIKGANVLTGQSFGTKMDLDHDTLVVGTPADRATDTTITNASTITVTNGTVSRGAAYVYKRTGTVWAQEAYIKDAIDNSDAFGTAVAVSGDTVVVGATGDDSNQTTISDAPSTNNSLSGSGAVYVYKRSGTTWAREAFLKPSMTLNGSAFGFLVGISGDTLAIGEKYNGGTDTTVTNGATTPTYASASGVGAVYVFKRTGTTWAQTAQLKPAFAHDFGLFGGVELDIDGTTIAVSVYNDDSNQVGITNGTTSSSDTSAGQAGSVYIFE